MSLFSVFKIAAGGLMVQRKRLDITAENLANVNSTRTPEGGAYRKKEAIVSSQSIPFEEVLDSNLKQGDLQTAAVVGVHRSTEPLKTVYDPSHPDADQNGNVSMPNVSATEEMIDMMTASKSYQANLTLYSVSKSMISRTLDMGSY
jgi:flagellar basal-body rod protein FlgC